MKMLSLNYHQHIHKYIHSVYKESPRHYLSTEIKYHKFWMFRTHYITTTLQNLGTSLLASHNIINITQLNI